MPKNTRNYYPNKSNYDFKVTIKDKDYSEDLIGLRIFASTETPYSTFILDFLLDPNDIILEKIFGQEPIKISIRLVNQDGILEEETSYELMYVKSNFKLTNKVQMSSNDQKEHIPIKIIAVPRKEFIFATSIVNAIYFNKTPREIIEDLINKVGAKLSLYDTDGENKNKIDQILIPPTTIMKAIKEHINSKFGLFDGPYYISFENTNEIKIQNLAKKINKDQTFNIYHLAQNAKDNKELLEKNISGKDFVTYTPLKSNFNLPSKISVLGNKLNYIVKPSDSLYHVITQEMTDIQKKGIFDKNKILPIDKLLQNREKFIINKTGHEKNDTFINAELGKITSSFSKLTLNIERGFALNHLLKTGEPVKVNSGTLEYSDLCGKYILQSTDLKFQKNSMKAWSSVATIYLIRTNKTLV